MQRPLKGDTTDFLWVYLRSGQKPSFCRVILGFGISRLLRGCVQKQVLGKTHSKNNFQSHIFSIFAFLVFVRGLFFVVGVLMACLCVYLCICFCGDSLVLDWPNLTLLCVLGGDCTAFFL